MNRAIYKLAREHLSKINRLKKEIEAAVAERNRLLDELEKLQEEKARQEKPQELMELALSRAGKAAVCLRDQAEAEAEAILSAARAKKEGAEKQAGEIEQEIKETSEYFKALMQKIKKLLANQQDLAAETMELQRGGKIVQIPSTSEKYRKKDADTRKAGRLDQKKTETGPEEKKQLLPAEQEMAAEQEIAAEQRMTADGTVVQNTESRGARNDYTRFLNTLSQRLALVQPGQDPSSPEAVETPPQKVKSRGFWDDNDSEPETAAEAEAEAKVKAGAKAEVKAGAKAEVKAGAKAEVTAAVGGNETAANADPNSLASLAEKSRAFEEEISRIRHRYIVGKLAGADLTDKDGNLIIARNQMITPEVVARAENEGKLPELIVNMVLPGMQD